MHSETYLFASIIDGHIVLSSIVFTGDNPERMALDHVATHYERSPHMQTRLIGRQRETWDAEYWGWEITCDGIEPHGLSSY